MKKIAFVFSFLFIISCNDTSPYKVTHQHFFLMEQLDQIEALIDQGKEIDTLVSQSNVEWHLDHMLKTINGIYDSLKASDPATYESNFNFIRSVVYLTGKIPRGVAQSPKSVLPPEVILKEDILSQLEQAREKMKLVMSLEENANFHHPKFNQLNRDQTLRFIEIHTNHHLSIIYDIIAD